MRHFFVWIILFSQLTLFAGYGKVNGKWSPEQFLPVSSVQDHYDAATELLHKKEWAKALTHFMVINYHFQESPFFADSLFYSGACYFGMGDLEVANAQFNKYLSQSGKLKHFEEVFEYKFEIAESFKQGKKKHLFGFQKLPKWMPAKRDAVTLYDEIIAALPGREIAAKALYSKAESLRSKREYRDSIEALKTLTRLYPKESLAKESYLMISDIYLQQAKEEAQNPDLISLAQLNLIRFSKSFPREKRVALAEKNILSMKEIYAKSLYDMGRFYERKKKPDASIIYYQDALLKYPDTAAASKCKSRLAHLGIDEMHLYPNNLKNWIWADAKTPAHDRS